MAEMEVFVAVIDNGGFTGAANKLRLSKSSVSKHVTNLESRLGVTLLNRTTRNVSATEIGISYYKKCVKFIEQIRDADLSVSAMQSEAQGTLRVSASSDFGSSHLMNCITPFLKQHSKIKIHLTLDNRFVDLVTEGFDVAIRIGNLSDSSLRARKISTTKLAIIGSKDYLKMKGTPSIADDLSDHQLLNYSLDKNNGFWRIPLFDGEERQFRGRNNLTVNDGKSLMLAAEAGLGLAYLPCFIYGEKVKDGTLQKILTELVLPELGVYIVYPPSEYISPKLRVFIDYLIQHFKGLGNETW